VPVPISRYHRLKTYNRQEADYAGRNYEALLNH
jgi:hypothetical protein